MQATAFKDDLVHVQPLGVNARKPRMSGGLKLFDQVIRAPVYDPVFLRCLAKLHLGLWEVRGEVHGQSFLVAHSWPFSRSRFSSRTTRTESAPPIAVSAHSCHPIATCPSIKQGHGREAIGRSRGYSHCWGTDSCTIRPDSASHRVQPRGRSRPEPHRNEVAPPCASPTALT